MSKKGLVIIGVTDESPALVDGFVERYEPRYPIVATSTVELEHWLGVKGFPTAAVIGPDGKMTWTDHFGYESAVEDALKDSEKGELWPKVYKKVISELQDGDREAAWAELRKVLDGKRLKDEDRPQGEEIEAWLKEDADKRLASARLRAEEGFVGAAHRVVELLSGADPAWPCTQDADEFRMALEERPTFKRELKAGKLFDEAQELARSKRTAEDALKIYQKIAKSYDDIPLGNIAAERADMLESKLDDS